jgi:hypothetical protein
MQTDAGCSGTSHGAILPAVGEQAISPNAVQTVIHLFMRIFAVARVVKRSLTVANFGEFVIFAWLAHPLWLNELSITPKSQSEVPAPSI